MHLGSRNLKETSLPDSTNQFSLTSGQLRRLATGFPIQTLKERAAASKSDRTAKITGIPSTTSRLRCICERTAYARMRSISIFGLSRFVADEIRIRVPNGTTAQADYRALQLLKDFHLPPDSWSYDQHRFTFRECPGEHLRILLLTTINPACQHLDRSDHHLHYPLSEIARYTAPESGTFNYSVPYLLYDT